MSLDLGASIVVDYQNVHPVGHDLFASTGPLPRHETLVDPLLFATRLVVVRNRLQREAMAHAVLRRVLVFRGQPSPEHDPKGYQLHPTDRARPVWNTRLDENDFRACWDLTDYR